MEKPITLLNELLKSDMRLVINKMFVKVTKTS